MTDNILRIVELHDRSYALGTVAIIDALYDVIVEHDLGNEHLAEDVEEYIDPRGAYYLPAYDPDDDAEEYMYVDVDNELFIEDLCERLAGAGIYGDFDATYGTFVIRREGN